LTAAWIKKSLILSLFSASLFFVFQNCSKTQFASTGQLTSSSLSVDYCGSDDLSYDILAMNTTGFGGTGYNPSIMTQILPGQFVYLWLNDSAVAASWYMSMNGSAEKLLGNSDKVSYPSGVTTGLAMGSYQMRIHLIKTCDDMIENSAGRSLAQDASPAPVKFEKDLFVRFTVTDPTNPPDLCPSLSNVALSADDPKSSGVNVNFTTNLPSICGPQAHYNYGDNKSSPEAVGAMAQHQYDKPGLYSASVNVKLLEQANKKTDSYKQIIIQSQCPVLENLFLSGPSLVQKDSPANFELQNYRNGSCSLNIRQVIFKNDGESSEPVSAAPYKKSLSWSQSASTRAVTAEVYLANSTHADTPDFTLQKEVRVEDALAGCSEKAVRSAFISGPVTAMQDAALDNFIFVPACLRQPSFSNENIHWELSNSSGKIAESNNSNGFSYTYTTPGLHLLKVELSNTAYGTITLSQQISIVAKPVVLVPPTPTPPPTPVPTPTPTPVAVNGACATPPNGTSSVAAPSGQLCASGTASAIENSSDPTKFKWSCAGANNGSTANCFVNKLPVINGACATPPNGTSSLYAPTGQLCASGTQSAVENTSDPAKFKWTCTGANTGTSASCFVTKLNPPPPPPPPPVPVNGMCATPPNGTSSVTVPMGTLCSSGTQSQVENTTDPTKFKWTCAGKDSGTNANCSVTKLEPVSGMCNQPPHTGSFVNLTGQTLCAVGTASPVDESDASKFKWSCAGTNGGAPASCYANKLTPQNGICAAPPNGTSSTEAPIGKVLCSLGSASAIDYSDPTKFKWTCSGINTGAPVACSMTRLYPQAGVCNAPPSGGSYISLPAGVALCSTGNASAIDTSDPAKFKWSCSGVNNGATTSCSAVHLPIINGKCSSLDNTSSVTAPSTGLCTSGTPTAVSTGANSFTWTCKGANTGIDDDCSVARLYPVNGACASPPNNGSYVTMPSGAICSSGNASPVTVGSNAFTWSCAGINTGTNAGCRATRLIPVNGACGTADHQSTVAAPTTGLCGSGNASGVTTNPSSYSWSCSGINNGTPSQCSAPRLIPQDGVCGTSSAQSTVNAPTAGLCSIGTASSVTTTSQNFTWSCSGVNTGSPVVCAAPRVYPVNGVCGSAVNSTVREQPSSTTLCEAGTISSLTLNGSTYSWNCNGRNTGTNAQCSTQISCAYGEIIENGKCIDECGPIVATFHVRQAVTKSTGSKRVVMITERTHQESYCSDNGYENYPASQKTVAFISQISPYHQCFLPGLPSWYDGGRWVGWNGYTQYDGTYKITRQPRPQYAPGHQTVSAFTSQRGLTFIQASGEGFNPATDYVCLKPSGGTSTSTTTGGTGGNTSEFREVSK
jgi:hypothetical protein